MVKLRHPDRLGLHVRVVLRGGVMIGPGRADLLEAIASAGSISAAARATGMSYKRAWDLVSAMNGDFREPLVEAAPGGSTGGGARLTPTGHTVLAAYRRIVEASGRATRADRQVLDRLLASAERDAQCTPGG